MRKAVAEFWNRQQGNILQILLGAVIVLFIAILIGVYVIAKRANPIMLDEQGKPVTEQTNGSY